MCVWNNRINSHAKTRCLCAKKLCLYLTQHKQLLYLWDYLSVDWSSHRICGYESGNN